MSNRQVSVRLPTIEEIQAPKGEYIAFLQNGRFMGFVELQGAMEIIYSALLNGHDVKSFKSYFDVVIKN